ncbi:MAG: hypothetical protein PHD72_03335 [Patescibacteria group bacterium]|nr:hypothetical protein [Patescibacteria group bacterium]
MFSFRRSGLAMVAVLIAGAWFLFNAAPAKAVNCTWTASTSHLMSLATNWDDGSQGPCADVAGSNLIFDGAATTTYATWDATMTTTAAITVNNDYTGVITIGAATATSTGNFLQNGGTVSTTGSGVWNIGGNFTIATGTWVGLSSPTIRLYGASKTIVVTTSALTSFAFPNLIIDNDRTVTGDVTTTGDITINSSGTLILGTNSLALAGNLSNSGAIVQTGGSVRTTGASKTLGGTGITDLYNLIIGGSTTILGDVTSTNVLTINTGSSLVGGAGTIKLTKTSGAPFVINGTGSFSASTSLVYYEGAVNAVATGTYYNLTVSSTATLSGHVTTTNVLTIPVNGTLDAASYNIVLTKESGVPLIKNGTFTCSASTVVYSGSTSATIASTTYYNLIVNTAGTLGNSATTTGNLTVNSGKSLALSTYNFVASSSIANSGTITQAASGLVTMYGVNVTLGGTGNTTLYNLTIQGATTTLAGNVTTTNQLKISADRELVAGNFTLTLPGTGTPLDKTGALFTASTSNVMYTNSSATLASSTYYNLTIGAGTATPSANLTVGNNLTVNANATMALSTYDLALSGNLANSGTTTQEASGTVTMSGANATLGGTGNTTLFNLTISGATTTLAGSVTTTNILTISANKELVGGGAYNILLTKATGSPLVRTGTFTPATSLVIFSGATDATIPGGAYYGLTVNTVGTLGASVTTTGDLTVNSGMSLNLSTYDLAAAGNVVNSGSIIQTGGTVRTTGASKTLGGTGITDLYNLVIGGSTTLLGDVTSTTYLTINTGSSLNGGAGTIKLIAASGAPFVINGTGSFSASTSLVYYEGAVNAVATGTYYNLTVSSTATLSGNVTTTNVLTIPVNGTLDAATYNIVLSKATGVPLIKNGTFTCSTSTVVYAGATSATIASTTYYNLIVNTAGTLGNSATTTNDLTVNSGGSLALSTYDLVAAGNIGNSGTITQTSGTTTLTGTAKTLGGTGNTTLYATVIAGTVTLAGNVTSSNTMTINTGKTLTGGSYDLTLPANGTPFIKTGTFTPGTSDVRYTGSGPVTTTVASYYDLTLGSGIYMLGLQTTSTGAFTNNGTTTLFADGLLYAAGTYNNNATTTELGVIIHTHESSKITDSSGTEVALLNTGTNSAYVTVEEQDANKYANLVETISITLTENTRSDSEAITLTETGVDTGIFRSAAIPFSVAAVAAANDGTLQVSGSGALTLAYTDSKDSTDTGSDTASFYGTAYSAGGTGSGTTGGGGSVNITYPVLGSPAVTVSGGTTVTTPAVTLLLSATNASLVAISENSAFAGGTWETYAASKSFTLSAGNGAKTIYVKFRSASGGDSAVQTVTLTKNITGDVVAPPAGGVGCPTLVAGDMVKVSGKPAIYAVNSALKILYFPSGDEFKSWRPTYGGYQTISQTCFDSLNVPISYPAAVNYHPGSYVVKRASSDQLYVVEPSNKLAKITPALATSLYGAAYKVMTVADPFWPHYVNRGTDVTTAKPHPGMLIKVGTVTYYVDTDNQLREVTAAGLTANGFQTKFIRTLSASAIEGMTKGATITAEIKALTDKTQG